VVVGRRREEVRKATPWCEACYGCSSRAGSFIRWYYTSIVLRFGDVASGAEVIIFLPKENALSTHFFFVQKNNNKQTLRKRYSSFLRLLAQRRLERERADAEVDGHVHGAHLRLDGLLAEGVRGEQAHAREGGARDGQHGSAFSCRRRPHSYPR
jgi:hypothetical protein